MIPLPFPIQKKARLVKPTTKGEEEIREENALEYEDSESEEDEAKGGHGQSALQKISQRMTTLAKVEWEEYQDYRKNNYQLHINNGKILRCLDAIVERLEL